MEPVGGTNKVVRDGKVAVLVSPGFGVGWSSWAPTALKELYLFDPTVVAWVEGGKQGSVPLAHFAEYAAANKNPDDDAYYDTPFNPGGADNLKIVWVPIGTMFRITEYDGFENIIYMKNMVFHVA